MTVSAFEFVDNLDSNQHVLQIIANSENGKNTQFQFIRNGLLKNEYCVYLTHENPNKIKNQMQEFGIDVNKFANIKLLHIHKVPNLLEHPEGALRGFQDFFNQIMPTPKPRFRLVGRAIENITAERGWKAEIEIERFVHSTFDEMDGMILCHYDYQKLGQPRAISYVRQLLDCHHGVIFSSIAEHGFACTLNHHD